MSAPLRRLILMLKYPRAGTVKTRLVPALGERRACGLHRGLVAHTLGEVGRFAAAGAGEEAKGDVALAVEIEVRLTGAPDEAAARAWLGNAVTIRDQGEGDLGQRMERATSAAFSDGAKAVVVIGGDCPKLTAEHLAAAFAALERNSAAVLGPATDGGYYLIGLRRPLPVLFQGIRWSSEEVLAQTLAVARTLALDVAQLAMLPDVDLPDDLPHWAATATARAIGRGGVSVIIPALNEEPRLGAALAAAQRDRPHEIIVVDGGSADGTLEVARRHDAIVLVAAGGRARQMNRGAAVATGEFLLFLHADTLLSAGYPALVRATLARPGVAGGAFRFSIDGDFAGRRLVEFGANWRARRRQMPYGDQGLFVRRDTFARVGGFPDLPIMEDYEFVRRLRRLGTIALADGVAVTSGRRWQRLGALRTTLINQFMVLGYRAGIAPATLAEWYRGAGRPRPGDTGCLPPGSSGTLRPCGVVKNQDRSTSMKSEYHE